ncbi:ATP synthase F1 subunit delta [Candidatus Poriferisodalis sp.]|uniref:ATP synthase F1 subunit delta n=1 Tax=Candidatus Poriferisodalis sp. TaxID=3101277 RepID=UPI003AF44987
MSERTEGYASAVVAIAQAEDVLDRVTEELSAVGRAAAENEELRRVLTDLTVPASRRIGIIEDLLAAQASPVTLNVVTMLVGAGRGGEIDAIADEALTLAAATRGEAVAEVRSAVALTDSQIARVAEALSRASGRNVTVHVVVDPEIIGGLSAQIGDTVFDGSVRTRLDKMKERLS